MGNRIRPIHPVVPDEPNEYVGAVNRGAIWHAAYRSWFRSNYSSLRLFDCGFSVHAFEQRLTLCLSFAAVVEYQTTEYHTQHIAHLHVCIYLTDSYISPLPTTANAIEARCWGCVMALEATRSSRKQLKRAHEVFRELNVRTSSIKKYHVAKWEFVVR